MRYFLLMAILSLFAVPFCMRTQTNPVDTSTSEGMAALLFLYPFEDVSTGLVAYFPFQGNAKDATGSGHDGTVSGATLTSNHRGIPGAAYFFTKASGHYIQASDTGLQTGAQARTTCLWANPSSLPIALQTQSSTAIFSRSGRIFLSACLKHGSIAGSTGSAIGARMASKERAIKKVMSAGF